MRPTRYQLCVHPVNAFPIFPDAEQIHHITLHSSPPSCQARRSIKPLLAFRHEHDLQPKLLSIRIPKAKLLILTLIQLARRHLEPNRLVRLSRNKQVLKILIRLLDALRKRIHHLPLGRRLGRRVRVLQLKQQPLLSRHGVANLGNLVPGPPNLDDVFASAEPGGDAGRQACGWVDAGLVLLAFALFAGGAAREVGLVLFALRVGEVGAIILVHGQAEPAFKCADVVFEKVRVFVEVDCFQG